VSYWHHYRRRYDLVGHLFQNRFKSPAVEAEGYLLSCGRYIERNPVEAGLVAPPWEYQWSSCRAYALGEADALVAPNPCNEGLSPDPARP
jgi:putative transposase